MATRVTITLPSFITIHVNGRTTGQTDGRTTNGRTDGRPESISLSQSSLVARLKRSITFSVYKPLLERVINVSLHFLCIFQCNVRQRWAEEDLLQVYRWTAEYHSRVHIRILSICVNTAEGISSVAGPTAATPIASDVISASGRRDHVLLVLILVSDIRALFHVQTVVDIRTFICNPCTESSFVQPKTWAESGAVASLGGGRGGGPPRWHHPGGDTRMKLIFCSWIYKRRWSGRRRGWERWRDES